MRAFTSTLRRHKNSEKIGLERGARQGDNISSKLFSACLQETVINKVDWDQNEVTLMGSGLITCKSYVQERADENQIPFGIEKITLESSILPFLLMNTRKSRYRDYVMAETCFLGQAEGKACLTWAFKPQLDRAGSDGATVYSTQDESSIRDRLETTSLL
ncbi:hypothetical protein Bbelb_277570 [Branchiostoma belcheri]|nr:hypothetical protein Bbelb_277570 [Branchiostoma belcheri]